jgi:hypothetical protein
VAATDDTKSAGLCRRDESRAVGEQRIRVVDDAGLTRFEAQPEESALAVP